MNLDKVPGLSLETDFNMFGVDRCEFVAVAEGLRDLQAPSAHRTSPRPLDYLVTRAGPPYAGAVLFYGVVSAQTEKVVEFFLERDAAEAMIREVKEDEPVQAEDLRVEAIELGLGLARA